MMLRRAAEESWVHVSPRAQVALCTGALVVAFGAHLALYGGTIVDDAFIMFRYARNLTDGLGLVFNPGERVEGISSLLWTLWIAAGLKLGLSPEGFAAGSGAFLGLAAMAYVGWRFHWLLALVLACSGPFAYWCVAGLETPLFVAVLFVALSEPFAVRALDMQRLSARATIGLGDGSGALCVAAIEPLEPHVPWDHDFLQQRAECYRQRGHPLAGQARVDLDDFVAHGS
jgi:hypothetical protein